MLFLLEHKDYIARKYIGFAAACLPSKDHLAVVLVPLLYVDLKYFLLWYQPLQPHTQNMFELELS